MTDNARPADDLREETAGAFEIIDGKARRRTRGRLTLSPRGGRG